MARIINPCPNCGYGRGYGITDRGSEYIPTCERCGDDECPYDVGCEDDGLAEAQRQAARVASIDMDKLYLDQLDFTGKAWETYMLQVLGLAYTRAGGLNAHG